MVSIKDVAKRAGVSQATVSYVMSGSRPISEATKKRVRKAMDELGYVPNINARSLAINSNMKTNAIDEIDMQYISGALNKAMELNLDVITLFFFMFQNKTADEVARYLQSQSITGIIIYGMSKEDKVLHRLISTGKFKCVVIDAPFVNVSTSCIGVDHRRAQYEVAAKTVMENNCKRILYIAGKRNGYVTDERIRGMEDLVKEKNLTMLVRNGEFSELQARNITLKYAKNKDIVVCASDLMAIGAMKALIQMDIFRPVCGFDGIILMGYVGKQMNTVRQDFASISESAMEELQELMNGGYGRNIVMKHSLVRMKYEDIIA